MAYNMLMRKTVAPTAPALQVLTATQFIKISRPRFYSYLFGSFLIGGAAGFAHQLQMTDQKFLLFLLFFTFPANLFLYGINDIYDTETDQHNPKKRSHEHLLEMQQHSALRWAVKSVAVLALSTLLLVNWIAAIILCAFMFLSYSYSAPPLRFKARPFWDAYSNLLYVLPGFFAYALYTQQFPSLPVVLMGLTWSAGMHAFSAIPDMTVDRRAGIATTAVYLGKQKTEVFVLANWLVFSLLCLYYFGVWGFLGWIPVLLVTYIHLKNKAAADFYWYFPYIIPSLGFLGFWYIFITRFGWQEIWQSSGLF